MAVSEAKKRASAKYDAAHAIYVSLKLNRETDADIIDALEAGAAKYGGKQGFIKALIRQSIEQNKEEES